MSFPSWLSWYKKPSYVDLTALAASYEKKATAGSTYSSPRSSVEINNRKDVPKKLSLERILKNQTCTYSCQMTNRRLKNLLILEAGSPMSMYDFYMYLKHIEHSPENLEFYIWYAAFKLARFPTGADHYVNRFKNYEAGRLTGNPDGRPKSSQHSDTESENNLETEDSKEKIDGIDTESIETMNLEQGKLHQSRKVETCTNRIYIKPTSTARSQRWLTPQPDVTPSEAVKLPRLQYSLANS